VKPGWKFRYVPPACDSINPFTATVHVHFEANADQVIEQFVTFLMASGFSEKVINDAMAKWKWEKE
jgi:hypothetical protein